MRCEQGGLYAALAKRFGANVQAEIKIDEEKGTIDIVVLKEVVDDVVDSSREVSVVEARWDDPEFQVGDFLEIPVELPRIGWLRWIASIWTPKVVFIWVME